YGDNAQATDLATGIRAAVTDASQVIVVPGSGVDAPIAGGIEAAAAAAHDADVVLLAIGEPQTLSGESHSRADITVPAAQMALARAVAAVGKPLVVVLKNGRALALEQPIIDAPAILVTWFLGTESGSAIADILFGAASPSARLPVSFPFATGQEPYHYDHKPTGRPNPPGPIEPFKTHFEGMPNAARFAFGHGLTYGKIDYSGLEMDDARLGWDKSLTVAAVIGNRGTRDAEEVVQLYIRDMAASVTRPVRELKAFQKIWVPAGGKTRVTFSISRGDLLFIGQQLKPVVEPGQFELWIAPSAQAEGLKGVFTLMRD
ncbi:glycoside hydrolase family 3 C-terminal domain-containing protein, partial [Sphingobium sp. Sx8-8]|uniref:glycoside hydrolase family 3 C-terminal domain-containing protein n=1 Tax=Sphingobium sp. Sx8-8 TaxID=2933617 RepID=UPI001F5A9E07